MTMPIEATAPPKPHREWFLTLTRRQFFYYDPESYPYDVGEIGHVLANLCRFGGHLDVAYSVAQHSVLVARTVEFLRGPNDRALLCAALLHDASEAFLLDIPRPLKRTAVMAPYRALEDRVQRAILHTFGLEAYHDHPAIKEADAMMLAAEKQVLRPPTNFASVEAPIRPSPVAIHPLSADEARQLFDDAWRWWGAG